MPPLLHRNAVGGAGSPDLGLRDKFVETVIDKVSVAKPVTSEDANLDFLDRKVQVKVLAKFLHSADRI